MLGVHTGAVPDPAERVLGLLRDMQVDVDQAQLRIRLDQVGAGYDSLTTETHAALGLAARRDGLVLDPVYSGRALAGLVAAVRDGDVRPDDTTVLLASGGIPGLFGHVATARISEPPQA